MARSRSRVSRRAFLGGAGAVLALPAFASLLPRSARAEDAIARRHVYFYVPNGIHMAAWTPEATGAGFELSPILAPLAAVKDKLLVLSGLDNTPSNPDGPGDHASGTGGFLTCRHVVKTEGADIKNGISADQVAAAQIGQLTRIPSLQLGTDGGSSAGGCDSGYSCAYARNVSWASETQPLPKTVNPQVVFDLLFEGFDPEATAAEIERRRVYKKSVLDYVLADSKTLSTRLGASDRKKLDEYMTGVSELEKKLAKPAGPACEAIDRPLADLPFQEHVETMLDLMVLAMQCDATRVITFMLGNAGSNRSYPFLGVSEGHHEISHHQGLQSNFDKLQTIDTWEVTQLAYLLEKMDAIQEADGTTLLDSSAVFFSSEIEDGNSHAHENVPVLLAGGCGGAFSTGRHVMYGGDPLANLFISMLDAVGVSIPTFGDNGTGKLADL
jgi:hypothetical protein